jgi:hypothetical protein
MRARDAEPRNRMGPQPLEAVATIEDEAPAARALGGG